MSDSDNFAFGYANYGRELIQTSVPLSVLPSVPLSGQLSSRPDIKIGLSELNQTKQNTDSDNIFMTDAQREANNSERKKVTISLTRANKILVKLRESTSESTVPQYKYARRKYMSGLDDSDSGYGVTVKYLTFSPEETQKKLQNIRETAAKKIIRKRLVERWKNKLFSLNVHYGLHDILGEIDSLNIERKELLAIINEYSGSRSKTYKNYKDTLASMDAVKTVEKKYDFTWDIAAFDVDELKKRLVSIEKQLSELDDKKDYLNIEKSFTMELSPLEYEMCGF